MHKQPHILNAASNLLGIALLIIAGLNVSQIARHSIADEIAWVAAICLSLSCLLSYLAFRRASETDRLDLWADRIFMAGLFTLFAAIVTLAIERA
jgi:ABC-type lipoprotein release transport system permease subunit